MCTILVDTNGTNVLWTVQREEKLTYTFPQKMYSQKIYFPFSEESVSGVDGVPVVSRGQPHSTEGACVLNCYITHSPYTHACMHTYIQLLLLLLLSALTCSILFQTYMEKFSFSFQRTCPNDKKQNRKKL